MFCLAYRCISIKIPLDQVKVIVQRQKQVQNGTNKTFYPTVDISFNLNSCPWLTDEITKTLKEMYPFFIDHQGNFSVKSESISHTEFLDRKKNEEHAIEKMEKMIERATLPRKEIIHKVEMEKQKLARAKLERKQNRVSNTDTIEQTSLNSNPDIDYDIDMDHRKNNDYK